MGKWTSLEHLSFYTFIIFNYDYIHNKKIIPKIVQNPQNPDQKSEKATKKLRRGKQLSGEFYTKMEEFFETELPNHKSRTRSQLRCKMNKLFPKKTKENLKRKKERWENGTIYFQDLESSLEKNEKSLHTSGYKDRVLIPFTRDCEVIECQIEKLFSISFRVEEIKPLNKEKLNSICWRDFHVVYYTQFCRFIKEMGRQKEIFRRNGFNGNDETQLLKKQQEFEKWIELMNMVLKKTERGLLYLSAEYQLLSLDKKLLAKFQKSSSESLKKKILMLKKFLKGVEKMKGRKRKMLKRC